jgi:hypothetical protein
MLLRSGTMHVDLRCVRGGRLSRILVLACCAAMIGGCTLTERLRSAAGASPPPAAEAGEQNGGLYIHLQTMNDLGMPDAARQADVFYEVERDYTRAPTTTSTLRYAVALVTPDHPASDPDKGKRLLETLLATPERMTQEERTLCAVLLHETNVRLKLETENRRLLETLDERNRSQANSERRVQAQIEENARLRRALAEAQQKLDAIKEIERSIIERSSAPPGSRDSTANSNEAQSSSIGR